MSAVRTTVTALLLLFVGCTEVKSPSGLQQDHVRRASLAAVGAAGAVTSFYFLPPLAPARAAAGEFMADLPVVVEVCAWMTAWSEASCDDPVATFSVGSGKAAVKIDADKEHYSAIWHTNAPGIDLATVYRIRVLLDGTEQGHLDVVFARGPRDDGSFRTINQRSSVPISFRVDGTAGEPEPETFLAGSAGGTFSLFGGRVIFVIPAGALSAETELSVRPANDPANQSGMLVVPGTTYRFAPAGLTFAKPVSLTLTFDPDHLPGGATAADLRVFHIRGGTDAMIQLATTAIAGATIETEIDGFSVYGLAAMLQALVRTWTGGAASSPTDWSLPGNWAEGEVPSSISLVSVLAGATHMPVLSADVQVTSLYIEAGASLNLNGSLLRVAGDLLADGPITGAGGRVGLIGAGTLRGNVPELWVLEGKRELDGPTTVQGRVQLGGPAAELVLAGHRLNVTGDFESLSAPDHIGRLVMTNAKDTLAIAGNARFAAPTGAGSFLTAGTLLLSGNFAQAVPASGAFRASGTHATVLYGTNGAQHVTFTTLTSSFFHSLLLRNAAGVVFGSDVVVNGTFGYQTAVEGAPVSGPDRTLTVRNIATLPGPVDLLELRIGGVLNPALPVYPYHVPTTTFTGARTEVPVQQMPMLPYRDVVIDGGNVELSAPVTIADNLTILNGDLRMAGRTLIVRNDFAAHGATSYLNMTGAADRFAIYGNAVFGGGTRASGMSDGMLWIRGNVSKVARSSALNATGNHTTVLFGALEQTVTMQHGINAGAGGFHKLAITNSWQGVRFPTVAGDNLMTGAYAVDLVGSMAISSGVVVSVHDIIFRSTGHLHNDGLLYCSGKLYRETGFNSSTQITGPGGGCQATGGVTNGGTPPALAPGAYDPPSALAVQIFAPAHGSVHVAGAPIGFAGQATNVVGDNLSGTALRWTSSLDGEIGTSGMMSTTSLQEGSHLITLEAVDSDGTTGYARVRIDVGAPAIGDILFTTDRHSNVGRRDVYSMNPAGTDVFRMTNDFTNLSSGGGAVSWSPDGTRIAFSTAGENGIIGIWVMNADGTDRQQLTDYLSHAPAWSPDGTELAIAAIGDNYPTAYNIFVINSTTGAMKRRVTNSPANDVRPDWSPDGQKLVITRASRTTIIDAQTGAVLQEIGSANSRSATWSPDGSRLARTTFGALDNIWIWDLASGVNTQITSAGMNGTAIWSPDGTHILYASKPDNTSSTKYDVWIMKVDGSGAVNLTNHPSSHDYPGSWRAAPAQ